MPSIHIKNTNQTIDTNMLRSILLALQMHGVAIETICGGKAMCGRCAIKIIKGKETLNRQKEAETARLTRIGADETTRLACQTFTRGNVEIEILNRGKIKHS